MIGIARALLFSVAVLSLAGCVEIQQPFGNQCSRAHFVKPDHSLGYDREPVQIELPKGEREWDPRPQPERKLLYRFDREPAGTTERLRSVCKVPRRGMVIAVGDHGTIRVRHPLFGWETETPGTGEDLRAVVWARLAADGAIHNATAVVAEGFAPGAARDPIVAVGAHGVATVSGSGRDGSWHLEDTGTKRDLVSIAHFGTFTIAVGVGGTMVERSKDGLWRNVETHTTADLAWVGWMGARIGAVGAGGTILECIQAEERLICIPRPSPVNTDLTAVSSAIFGRGVRLTSIGAPPVEWRIAPESAAPWFREDEILAVSDDLAVGRDGLVLLLSRAFGAPYSDKQPPGAIKLPYGVDLHGVVFNGIDGYAVGDKGTIVHIGVHGKYVESVCDE